jgi:NitT/TauT family transport system substrate-binding protein
MKKQLSLLLVSLLAAAAVFSGCSGQTEKQTTASATTIAVPETDAAVIAPPETAESAAENAAPGAPAPAVETADAPHDGNAETVTVRIGAMSGPTAMGMVKLMSDSEAGAAENVYDFADLATEASAMVTPLAQGELDIAAVPSNLAAALYAKTNGGIRVLAVNTLGVLNLLERGETITGVKDLTGKKLYATGQGAVPEFVIRYLLTGNGIDPDQDLEIQWCADTTEALSYLKEAEGAIAVLPQPFATAAMSQVEGLRIVQDLNDAWAELDPGCEITTGVTVVRTAFAEEHPEAVETFLKEYSASAAYASEDVEGAAALTEKYGIVAKAPLAQKALPKCHIVCLTGSEMKEALEGFLQVLFDQKPEAVGGAMPGDDFYYGIQ